MRTCIWRLSAWWKDRQIKGPTATHGTESAFIVNTKLFKIVIESFVSAAYDCLLFTRHWFRRFAIDLKSPIDVIVIKRFYLFINTLLKIRYFIGLFIFNRPKRQQGIELPEQWIQKKSTKTYIGDTGIVIWPLNWTVLGVTYKAEDTQGRVFSLMRSMFVHSCAQRNEHIGDIMTMRYVNWLFIYLLTYLLTWLRYNAETLTVAVVIG